MMLVQSEPAPGTEPPGSTTTLPAWFHGIATRYGTEILTLQLLCSRPTDSLGRGTTHASAYAEAAPAAAIAIHQAIADLSPLEREVVLADFAAGGAALARGLAHRFGTTLNVIYVTRSHARAKLRRSVEESSEVLLEVPTRRVASHACLPTLPTGISAEEPDPLRPRLA